MAQKTCQELLDEYQALNHKLEAAPLDEKGRIRKRRAVVLYQLRDRCEDFLASKRLKATPHGLVEITIPDT